ncbi:hypothetical protein [Microbacterium oxydans]|uniref:Uncharacterized protein n=1 Tax=Microbacterium oxydans TaxID=82380 RepID=A0A0F0LAX1_9MICO|nr:hypothetical protein [Microbacterium oxydans]KJL30273.1 hypothetical protein RS83_01023 [Microbacterium oxydans]
MRTAMPGRTPDGAYVARVFSPGLGNPAFFVGVRHHGGAPDELAMEYTIGTEAHQRRWRLRTRRTASEIFDYELVEDSSSAGYVSGRPRVPEFI